MEKINILCIFSGHLQTLRHHSRDKFSWSDIFVFYILPFVGAVVASFYLSDSFVQSISTELMTFYSIISGFLLNLLVLIYGFDVDKFKDPKNASKVLKETGANISYLITLSILVILVLFAVKVALHTEGEWNITLAGNNQIELIKQFLTVFIITSLLNFALTVFMVLKRFYSLDYNRKTLADVAHPTQK